MSCELLLEYTNIDLSQYYELDVPMIVRLGLSITFDIDYSIIPVVEDQVVDIDRLTMFSVPDL